MAYLKVELPQAVDQSGQIYEPEFEKDIPDCDFKAKLANGIEFHLSYLADDDLYELNEQYKDNIIYQCRHKSIGPLISILEDLCLMEMEMTAEEIEGDYIDEN
jgi:hypothetical protein